MYRVYRLLAAAALAMSLAACDSGTEPPDYVNVGGVWSAPGVSLSLYDDNPDPSAEDGFNVKHAEGGAILVYWGTYTARSDSVFLTFRDERMMSDGAWQNGTDAITVDHVEHGVIQLVRTEDAAN